VPAIVLLLLAAWNYQFMGLLNQERLGTRGEAVTLDRLAAEQSEDLLRATRRHLPEALWLRAYDWLKGVWLDAGPRSLDGRVELGEGETRGLVGLGWSAPRREGAVVYRSTRGDSADLDLPIRHPHDLWLTLRARRDPPGGETAAARLCLDVNDRPLCCFTAPDDWADVRARIPGARLVSGPNRLVVRNMTVHRRALAIDRLVFEDAAPMPVDTRDETLCAPEP
jgi:hypothetical protein